MASAERDGTPHGADVEDEERDDGSIQFPQDAESSHSDVEENTDAGDTEAGIHPDPSLNEDEHLKTDD